MRLPRISLPPTAVTLAMTIAAGATGVTPLVRAEDQPLLALPTAQALDGHRTLVADDAVRLAPDAFDVDAARAAALDQLDRFDATTWDIAELAASPGT